MTTSMACVCYGCGLNLRRFTDYGLVPFSFLLRSYTSGRCCQALRTAMQDGEERG
jgi:hypothetical protein